MSERTGIDWLGEPEINGLIDNSEAMKLALDANHAALIAQEIVDIAEAAARLALSRAESAITEGDVDALPRGFVAVNGFSHFDNELVFRQDVKSLIRSRQSGERTIGIPDHICGICYHPNDTCSHCDTRPTVGTITPERVREVSERVSLEIVGDSDRAAMYRLGVHAFRDALLEEMEAGNEAI